MKRFIAGAGAALLCGAAGSAAPVPAAPAPTHHEISITVEPSAHRLRATDTITWPAPIAGPVVLTLHEGLTLTALTSGVTLRRLPPAPDRTPRAGEAPMTRWEARSGTPLSSLALRYEGMIHHPPEAAPAETARGFSETPGTIQEEGLYLTGSSAWVPMPEEKGPEQPLMTFSIHARVPPRWIAVAPGRPDKTADGSVRWVCEIPQTEASLVGGPFIVGERTGGGHRARVYLRTKDDALAEQYLQATLADLEMYEGAFGAYPYDGFSLVENWWETGYGLPSYTLLGPKVIRLPFLLTSSYPHEILHSWWGNGVFVREEEGNWCEGLTAYLADHLFQEIAGRGAEWRQGAVQGYGDYVKHGSEIALRNFRERHSPATEAIGYGKSAMLFHEVRRRIGSPAFLLALRRFYEANRFQRAGFADLRQAFEQAGGTDLRAVFAQATERTGAPAIALKSVATRRADESAAAGERWLLEGAVEQTEDGEPYDLQVPLAVTMEGRDTAWSGVVRSAERSARFAFYLPARPLRVDLDPEFDLIRRLDPNELPVALSALFGADKPLFVIPAGASPDETAAWKSLAAAWAGGGGTPAEIRADGDLQELPPGRAVWLLGWENRFAGRLGLGATPRAVTFEGKETARTDHGVAAVVRRPGDPAGLLGWVASDRVDAIPGLARKLPHYHRQSWLVFEGAEPVNTAKGRWPVTDSPLTAMLDPSNPVERAALPNREPLLSPPESFSSDRMMKTIRDLADPALAGRALGTPGLDRAAEMIATAFREAGLAPFGGTSFQDGGAPPDGRRRLRNVLGVVPGKDPARARECLVVGAHYDHLGTDARGLHAGADDNASGVAVLLEVARTMARTPGARTIVFAAFSGEEEARLGSKQFAERLAAGPYPDCRAMINLDTVGRLGTGKLMVLGAGSAAEWPHIFQGAGYVTGAPLQIVPGDPGGSDQVSFAEAGIPAVQLVAPPHADWHTPRDTPDKIDVEGLVTVCRVLREAAAYLADRPDPLTKTAEPRAASRPGPGAGSAAAVRRASLGTIPDYAFAGPGIRITGVTPGSAAEKARLREGDILTAIDGEPIVDLKGYAAMLAARAPGQKVTLTLRRGGETMQATAELGER